MNRKKQLAKNTLILSIGTFLPKFAATIIVPVLTGKLTKVEMGTYDLLSTLASLLLPITTFQIQSAAFRFLIDVRENLPEKKKVISNIYLFCVPISLVVLSILYFALPFNKGTKLLVAFYLLVDIMLICSQQVIRGLSNNVLYSLSAAVQSIIYTVLILLFVGCLGWGLNGVLISFVLSALISLIVVIVKGNIYQMIDFSCSSVKGIKSMLEYSWPMIPNSLSSWVLNLSDRLVLSGFMGLEAAAVYGVANKIPHLLSAAQGTFTFAWQENASLALSDADVEKYYSDMFDRIFCILSGILALLIASTPILFWLLIRGDYFDAYPQMPILFMGMFFSALSSFVGGIYIAHKKTKSVGLTTMLAAACNLIIDLAFVKWIGIYAASISTLVSYTILFTYRVFAVRRFQRISYRKNKLFACFTILIGMCVLCWINTVPANLLNIVIGCVFAYILNKELATTIWKSIKCMLSR